MVKWPRFAFEKFPGVDRRLSTHMKSVGEVMAIGRTFQQAFAKAMRSREIDVPADCVGETDELVDRLRVPGAERYDVLFEVFRRGVSVEEVHEATGIEPWFLHELHALATDPEGPFAGPSARSSPSTPAAPSSPPRRRTTTPAGSARPATRSAAATSRA